MKVKTIRKEFLNTLKFLEKRPIPSGSVAQFLPRHLEEYGLDANEMIVGIGGSRNIAYQIGNSSCQPTAVLIAHADKITLVPCGERLIPDCQIRGLATEKDVAIIGPDGKQVETAKVKEEGGEIVFASVVKTKLDPRYRVLFKSPLNLKGNRVRGGGLDNNCGMTVLLHLINSFLCEMSKSFLFIFSDNEEGPAKNGRFGVGARELDIILHTEYYIDYTTPVIIVDGVDSSSKESIDDDGQANLAWEISDGTRGIISQRTAIKLYPFVKKGLVQWWNGYTSGSDDWNLDHPYWFRVGVRGGDWHHQAEGPPYANFNDIIKVYEFLIEFLKSL